MINTIFVIDEIKQLVNYYVLPNNQTEKLFVNLPEIIHEKYSDWINNKNSVNLFLETKIKKYTFTKAVVNYHKQVVNRYGENSRDIKISFIEMQFGIRRNKC